MKKPEIGAVFINPRGREYEVIGHMLDQHKVVVRDRSSGMHDIAMWELMTEENGWHEVAFVGSDSVCTGSLAVDPQDTFYCVLNEGHDGDHKGQDDGTAFFWNASDARSSDHRPSEASPLNPDTPSRLRARRIIAQARAAGDALDFGFGLEAKIMAALDEARSETALHGPTIEACAKAVEAMGWHALYAKDAAATIRALATQTGSGER